jgi:hypothetical protein
LTVVLKLRYARMVARGRLLRIAVVLSLFVGGAGVAVATGVGASSQAEYVTTIKTTPDGNPTKHEKRLCKEGGWQNWVREDLTPFESKHDCYAYVHGGGILVPK